MYKINFKDSLLVDRYENYLAISHPKTGNHKGFAGEHFQKRPAQEVRHPRFEKVYHQNQRIQGPGGVQYAHRRTDQLDPDFRVFDRFREERRWVHYGAGM